MTAVAVMQPYFFPYLGYWQLIRAVDKFVIFDDVNFITRGWIHKNRICINDRPGNITLILNKASRNKLIKELSLDDTTKWKSKLLKTIDQSYKKAPCHKAVFGMLEGLILHEEENLARYLSNIIQTIVKYLEIDTVIEVSSVDYIDVSGKGAEKIINICLKAGGDRYVNAIGGQELYQKQDFSDNGLELCFLKTHQVEYIQLSKEFIPDLSIIDVLMNNDIKTVRGFLDAYDLV